jgi:hypothetical protein
MYDQALGKPDERFFLKALVSHPGIDFTGKAMGKILVGHPSFWSCFLLACMSVRPCVYLKS